MAHKLTQAHVDTVAAYMTGKRREKFLASVAILNESLALGGWIKRGKVKATSGFYQGLSSTAHFATGDSFSLEMSLRFGSAESKYGLGRKDKPFADLTDEELAHVCRNTKGKVTPEVVRAWLTLCTESDAAHRLLDKARPLPTITAIGLSPKVTKTLTEMNLDLELPSIKIAKISFYLKALLDDDGKPVIDKVTGKPVMVPVYYVDWTPGTQMSLSRFAGRDCEACGKTIPSQNFVPVEADCKKNGHIGLWLGTDCAKNIFGIKDVGISKEGPPDGKKA